MNNKYNMIVYIPAFNCVEEIDKTIKSILNQTFERRRLKIVVIDNHSTDGTYEKLLNITVLNKDVMSVFRLNKSITPSRMWKKAAELLKYTNGIGYSTVVKPGSILQSTCLEKVTFLFETMRYFEGNVIICEADMFDKNNDLVIQNPIFNENCILKSQIHNTQFFTTGIGHKIQAFYRGFFINPTISLDIINGFVDYSDWFSKGFLNLGDSIYLKEKLATVKEDTSIDIIEKLMTSFTMLKKLFYEIESNIHISVENNMINWNVVNDSYKSLSTLALKYAVYELLKNNIKIAKKCLLFSEMTYLEITKEEFYNSVKDVTLGRKHSNVLTSYIKSSESIRPPLDCFTF